MKVFTSRELSNLDKNFRRNLINQLPGHKPANLIGTISADEKTNVAIFASVHHLGANPPLMGFNMRPVSVERHTYENIIQKECFTINHVTTEIYEQAHQTAARYPKEQSEFEAAGLHEFYGQAVDAPYVAESPVKIGLKLKEVHDIKANNTKLIVGEVVEIILNDETMDEEGNLDFHLLNLVTVTGLDTYHSSKSLKRLPL